MPYLAHCLKVTRGTTSAALCLVLLAAYSNIAFAQPWGDTEAQKEQIPNFFCGETGQRCCKAAPTPGGAVIDSPHCSAGLGCDAATNRCVAPCGGDGQVCCDGPDTIAPRGGAHPTGPYCPRGIDTCAKRKPMCNSGTCNNVSRRCTSCGQSVNSACCLPDLQHALATCRGAALACQHSDVSMESGICVSCGGEGQIGCPRCAEGQGLTLNRTGVCICDPEVSKTNAVTSSKTCTLWLDRRSKSRCFRGACVEGAFADPENGVLSVDLDNPRIWANYRLPLVSTQARGLRPIEVTRTPLGINIYNGDLFGNLFGGDGDASTGGFFEANTSGPASAVTDELPPWTTTPGEWSAARNPNVLLEFLGARLGHKAMGLRLIQRNPRHSDLITSELELRLNPNVLLVPVQVFVLYSDEHQAPREIMPVAKVLSLFDRVPTANGATALVTDSQFGELDKTTRAMSGIVESLGTALPTIAGLYLPDDIWAQCGIQFRLVNYSTVKVPHDILFPENRLTTRSALHEMGNEVEASSRFIPDLLTVILAPYCTDVDNPHILGQSLNTRRLACARLSSDPSVLAHELGHVIMHVDNYTGHQCGDGTGTAENVMCETSGIGTALTNSQCKLARERVGNMLRFPGPR